MFPGKIGPRSLLLLLVLCMVVVLPACGNREEAPPAEAPATAEAPEAPAVAEAPEAPGVVDKAASVVERAVDAVADLRGEHAAVTLEALQYMPRETHLAIGLPPVRRLGEQAAALEQRLGGGEVDMQGSLDGFAQRLAEELDLEEVRTFEDLSQALGMDLDRPLAIFVDLSPAVLEAAAPAAPEAEEALEDELAVEDPVAAPGLFFGAGDDEMDFPFVAVLPIADRAVAEARIAQTVAEDASLAGTTPETIEVGEVQIVSYGAEELSYFFAEDALMLGSSRDLARGAAARVGDPATFIYGTAAAPPASRDEVVALFFGARLLPALEQAQPGGEALAAAQLENLRTLFKGASEDDAIIVSLALEEREIKLQSRMDTQAHPGFFEIAGTPAPLRQARLLPESTQLLVSLLFTDAAKGQVAGQFLGATPEPGADAGLAQQLAIGTQVLGMIQDEITVAVTGAEDDFPAIFLLVSLSSPDATRALLQMFVPAEVEESHHEVEILRVEAPAPLPVFAAFSGNLLLASNDIEQMKAVLDRQREGGAPGVFEALDPPLNPETPRYSVLLLKSSLISDVIIPLSALQGGLPPAWEQGLRTFADNVQELRAVSAIEGGWAVQDLTLTLR